MYEIDGKVIIEIEFTGTVLGPIPDISYIAEGKADISGGLIKTVTFFQVD